MKTDAHMGVKLNDQEKLELEKITEAINSTPSATIRALVTAFIITYRSKGSIEIPLRIKSKTDIQLEEVLVCINSVNTLDELRDVILTVVIPGYPLSFDVPIRQEGVHERELREAIEKRLDVIRRKL